jgi:hypothetical protein
LYLHSSSTNCFSEEYYIEKILQEREPVTKKGDTISDRKKRKRKMKML